VTVFRAASKVQAGLAFQNRPRMLAVVQTEFRYRGRNISGAEIESVRQLIAEHPGLSRRRLSAKLCQAWNWVQANGQLRDMVARSLMLQLHRAGLIALPAKRKSVPTTRCGIGPRCWSRPGRSRRWNAVWPSWGHWRFGKSAARRRKPSLAGCSKLSLSGYRRPVGEHVKYLVYGRASRLPVWRGRRRRGTWVTRPFHRLVCIAAASPDPPAGLQHAIFDFALGASSTLGQSFVGSSGAPNLGRLAATLPASYLFAGNFHRAGPLSRHLLSRGQLAFPGLTTGRGKDDLTHQPNRSLKELWVQPLGRDFRQRLCREGHE